MSLSSVAHEERRRFTNAGMSYTLNYAASEPDKGHETIALDCGSPAPSLFLSLSLSLSLSLIESRASSRAREQKGRHASGESLREREKERERRPPCVIVGGLRVFIEPRVGRRRFTCVLFFDVNRVRGLVSLETRAPLSILSLEKTHDARQACALPHRARAVSRNSLLCLSSRIFRRHRSGRSWTTSRPRCRRASPSRTPTRRAAAAAARASTCEQDKAHAGARVRARTLTRATARLAPRAGVRGDLSKCEIVTSSSA